MANLGLKNMKSHQISVKFCMCFKNYFYRNYVYYIGTSHTKYEYVGRSSMRITTI